MITRAEEHAAGNSSQIRKDRLTAPSQALSLEREFLFLSGPDFNQEVTIRLKQRRDFGKNP
jgi:hypothetical protein